VLGPDVTAPSPGPTPGPSDTSSDAGCNNTLHAMLTFCHPPQDPSLIFTSILSAVWTRINPLTPTVTIWVQLAVKHPVPDRVKPSFVIFDIRAPWRSALSARVPECQKLQLTDLTRSGTGCFTASCTHMVTVGIGTRVS